MRSKSILIIFFPFKKKSLKAPKKIHVSFTYLPTFILTFICNIRMHLNTISFSALLLSLVCMLGLWNTIISENILRVQSESKSKMSESARLHGRMAKRKQARLTPAILQRIRFVFTPPLHSSYVSLRLSLPIFFSSFSFSAPSH